MSAQREGLKASFGPSARLASGNAVLQGLFGLEKESRIGMTGAKDGIVAEGAGMRVVPDNGVRGKIYEFVTVPFDEHTRSESKATDQVTEQLDKIWSMMGKILALRDKEPVDPVFEAHGLGVKQSTKRRTGPDSYMLGPVHFTVGLKLGEWQQQSVALKELSKGGPAAKSESARMDHADRSVVLWQEIHALASKVFDPKKQTAGELAGYLSLAYLTIAGWQANLDSIEDLNKQVPLAFLKVPPSKALAGIQQSAKQAGEPDVEKWVAANEDVILAKVEAKLPKGGDAGAKSLRKLKNWLLGKNDDALNVVDGQVTAIPEKESLGSASAVPYGYAAELRNIAVGNTDAKTEVRDAAIRTIRASRGPGERISQEDSDYGRHE